MPNDWRTERGRIAALTRSRPADDPDLIEARRQFRATRLADHVAKALADRPPLSDAQREAIARLLTSPAGELPEGAASTARERGANDA